MSCSLLCNQGSTSNVELSSEGRLVSRITSTKVAALLLLLLLLRPSDGEDLQQGVWAWTRIRECGLQARYYSRPVGTLIGWKSRPKVGKKSSKKENESYNSCRRRLRWRLRPAGTASLRAWQGSSGGLPPRLLSTRLGYKIPLVSLHQPSSRNRLWLLLLRPALLRLLLGLPRSGKSMRVGGYK